MGRAYAEKLRDPQWQRLRLRMLDAAGWKCVSCGATDRTLHVHHRSYRRGAEPWEYPDENFVVLCINCHQRHHLPQPAPLQAGAEPERVAIRTMEEYFAILTSPDRVPEPGDREAIAQIKEHLERRAQLKEMRELTIRVQAAEAAGDRALRDHLVNEKTRLSRQFHFRRVAAF